MLKDKKIILCITGSIAAYKSVYLLRLLVKEDAVVKIVMTEGATKFVSPLTFSTLSNDRVMVHLFENNNWENHSLLGRWGDLILVVPASANTIGKMANGLCDNLLMAVYLSAACPVFIAPAMDEDMWKHPATRRNIQKLIDDKVKVLKVGKGSLASGLSGMGRVAEPEEILQEIKDFFHTNSLMAGKKVLITSGPTVEPIDPVRFISNYSTGKMGVALANSFKKAGADVTLITGPTVVDILPGINIIRVNTAREMYEACMKEADAYKILIMAAAVADYTPVNVSAQKIKKAEDDLHIVLKPTRDILLSIGESKKSNQLLIGFALETENGKQNAVEKLKRKNADYIILNSLNDEGAGFGSDTNKISIFGKDGSEHSFPLKAKVELATDIVTFISKLL